MPHDTHTRQCDGPKRRDIERFGIECGNEFRTEDRAFSVYDNAEATLLHWGKFVFDAILFAADVSDSQFRMKQVVGSQAVERQLDPAGGKRQWLLMDDDFGATLVF
jgi:hypothetical protein